ncbi:MAG: T3SS effector HopA1 family protein [Myxococcaceae bacterium]
MTLFEQIERGLKHGRSEDQLTQYLYEHHHLDWDRWQPPHFLGDTGFVAELERAAGGARCLQAGWHVLGLDAAGLVASNGAVRLWVPRRPGAWLPAKPRVGAPVRLSFPCARAGAMPGYFVLVSRAGHAPFGPSVKLYLNLKPSGAVALVRELMRLRVRFDAKLFNHPLAYGRRDTAVVYCAPRDVKVMTRALQRFVRSHPAHVRAQPVPFTTVLGRGLSIGQSLEAEEREGVSYGELRCRLVARAVLRAPRERWLDEIRRTFKRAGTDFDQPWPPGRPGSAARRG